MLLVAISMVNGLKFKNNILWDAGSIMPVIPKQMFRLSVISNKYS